MEQKILFADHLRGAAALAVIISHLVVCYNTDPGLVTYYTLSHQLNPSPPLFVIRLAQFDLGAFGVALFFLISGFVIPFSFRRHSARTFLIARALRIWPTYLAALACGLAVRYASSYYWGSPFNAFWPDIIANALLLQDFVGSDSLDGVNWSLTIEIIFYMVFAAIYPMVLRYRERVVLYAACVLPVALAMTANFPNYFQLDLIDVRLGACLPFMLVGTLFYLHIEGLVTLRSMLPAALFSVVAVTICFAKLFTPTLSMSYGAAFAIFLGLFLVRGRIGQNPVLAGLSAISYPLYLVHSVIGFNILQFATMGLGFSYASALAAATIVVFSIASALHFTIERHSMALGSRLAPQTR